MQAGVYKHMIGYALKELRKRKRKYLLNIMVIVLVVVLLITLNSLGVAFKEASRLPFENIHSSIIIQRNGNVPENTSGAVTPCSLAPIKGEFIPQIGKIGSWVKVTENHRQNQMPQIHFCSK
jgi:hypothetical protein